MTEIYLTYPTDEGSREIKIERERTTLGRGSDADFRFDDDGLSRLNSTVYRDGERVWIVDENSTNGTFVNGEKVGASGSILKNGDAVKIGNHTKLKVGFSENKKFAAAANSSSQTSKTISSNSNKLSSFLPVALIAFAFFVIAISAVFVGFTVLDRKSVV